MFFLISGFLLFLIQTLFIYTTNFHFHPEVYFFPWLVAKGLVPYRDFFDHHGFLLYYLLAPITVNFTFTGLRAFYFSILSIKLFFVLVIFKKTTTKIGYLLGGFTYVLVSYFINENYLWFETIITLIYLVLYFLSLQRKNSAIAFSKQNGQIW